MTYDEPLVGSLAIVLGVVSIAIAAGPWEAPYRLRTLSAVSENYGKVAARLVWLVIAMATLMAGIAILSGTRPPYATPTQHSVQQ